MLPSSRLVPRGNPAGSAAPPRGAAFGALAGATLHRSTGRHAVVSAFGGRGAVRVVGVDRPGSHARVNPYGGGRSPYARRAGVYDLEVVDPKKVRGVGRLVTAGRDNLHGRFGAPLKDLTGLTPREAAVRYNLAAAKNPQLQPNRVAPRSFHAGERFRVGVEGAPAYRGSAGSRARLLARRVALRTGRPPLQVEFLDYPGRSASSAAVRSYAGKFGSLSGLSAAEH